MVVHFARDVMFGDRGGYISDMRTARIDGSSTVQYETALNTDGIKLTRINRSTLLHWPIRVRLCVTLVSLCNELYCSINNWSDLDTMNDIALEVAILAIIMTILPDSE